ncbi:MAG: hypothetical protein HZB26_04695 [Candidatus Hydrogenedentes bacterium]|nr:hypothetical protein [Candidatus Hydrogenedentota bacterium]
MSDVPSQRAPNMSPAEIIALGLLVPLMAILLYAGWHTFWFLTDDAYIAFRYVSNSQMGHGYVWNPAPFRPVEGYTSFLWVALLDWVWSNLGISPPDAANGISLGFAALTLVIGACAVLQITWTDRLRPYRVVFVGLVMFATISNRTFLAWTSSGLETAMFNFLFTAWLLLCLSIHGANQTRRMTCLSALASLAALTRPDGLPIALATALLIGATSLYRAPASISILKRLTPLMPLLAVPAHLLWRKNFYGEWLPNSYYAKVASQAFGWEFGWRYLLSFVMEYALWLWLIAALAAAVHTLRRAPQTPRRFARKPDAHGIAAGVGIGCVLFQVSYYVIRVGGDHFEFRIFSYLILLAFISYTGFLNRVFRKPGPAILAFLFFIAVSWVIPWTHWAAARSINLPTRVRISVADALGKSAGWTPSPLKSYAKLFDELQGTLIDHGICIRHEEHVQFSEAQRRWWPTREEGMRIGGEGYPILVEDCVGYPGWALPRINIIDSLGLNDYVVARSAPEKKVRFMAHDRVAPQRYLKCFSPNVEFNKAAGTAEFLRGKIDPRDWKVRVAPRDKELTAAKICECERDFALMRGLTPPLAR